MATAGPRAGRRVRFGPAAHSVYTFYAAGPQPAAKPREACFLCLSEDMFDPAEVCESGKKYCRWCILLYEETQIGRLEDPLTLSPIRRPPRLAPPTPAATAPTADDARAARRRVVGRWCAANEPGDATVWRAAWTPLLGADALAWLDPIAARSNTGEYLIHLGGASGGKLTPDEGWALVDAVQARCARAGVDGERLPRSAELAGSAPSWLGALRAALWRGGQAEWAVGELLRRANIGPRHPRRPVPTALLTDAAVAALRAAEEDVGYRLGVQGAALALTRLLRPGRTQGTRRDGAARAGAIGVLCSLAEGAATDDDAAEAVGWAIAAVLGRGGAHGARRDAASRAGMASRLADALAASAAEGGRRALCEASVALLGSGGDGGRRRDGACRAGLHLALTAVLETSLCDGTRAAAARAVSALVWPTEVPFGSEDGSLALQREELAATREGIAAALGAGGPRSSSARRRDAVLRTGMMPALCAALAGADCDMARVATAGAIVDVCGAGDAMDPAFAVGRAAAVAAGALGALGAALRACRCDLARQVLATALARLLEPDVGGEEYSWRDAAHESGAVEALVAAIAAARSPSALQALARAAGAVLGAGGATADARRVEATWRGLGGALGAGAGEAGEAGRVVLRILREYEERGAWGPSIIVGGSVFAAVSVALIKGLTSGDPEMCQACGGAGGVRCFACEGTGKMGGMDADALREKTNSPASLMEANLGETNPRECKACKGSGLLLCAKCNGTGYSKRL
ncbi:unnamed protein product [Pedinophyceae sp. YPF-701]|nr:unnamed protein product [Pedinophyceae sp. YPF-701]